MKHALDKACAVAFIISSFHRACPQINQWRESTLHLYPILYNILVLLYYNSYVCCDRIGSVSMGKRHSSAAPLAHLTLLRFIVASSPRYRYLSNSEKRNLESRNAISFFSGNIPSTISYTPDWIYHRPGWGQQVTPPPPSYPPHHPFGIRRHASGGDPPQHQTKSNQTNQIKQNEPKQPYPCQRGQKKTSFMEYRIEQRHRTAGNKSHHAIVQHPPSCVRAGLCATKKTKRRGRMEWVIQG